MLVCQSCGGSYEPIQADGTQYFHRCPPLSAVELAAAVKAGKVKLPDGETADDAVERRTYEREDLRDENIRSTKREHAGTVKAEGRGAVEVEKDIPAVVVVQA